MAEEAPQTVIVERSGGGGFGTIVIGLALLIGVLVGAYFLYNATMSENKKNDAITRAADKVGDTADKVEKHVP